MAGILAWIFKKRLKEIFVKMVDKMGNLKGSVPQMVIRIQKGKAEGQTGALYWYRLHTIETKNAEIVLATDPSNNIV